MITLITLIETVDITNFILQLFSVALVYGQPVVGNIVEFRRLLKLFSLQLDEIFHVFFSDFLKGSSHFFFVFLDLEHIWDIVSRDGLRRRGFSVLDFVDSEVGVGGRACVYLVCGRPWGGLTVRPVPSAPSSHFWLLSSDITVQCFIISAITLPS